MTPVRGGCRPGLPAQRRAHSCRHARMCVQQGPVHAASPSAKAPGPLARAFSSAAAHLVAPGGQEGLRHIHCGEGGRHTWVGWPQQSTGGICSPTQLATAADHSCHVGQAVMPEASERLQRCVPGQNEEGAISHSALPPHRATRARAAFPGHWGSPQHAREARVTPHAAATWRATKKSKRGRRRRAARRALSPWPTGTASAPRAAPAWPPSPRCARAARWRRAPPPASPG